jgi:hypothetical protein
MKEETTRLRSLDAIDQSKSLYAALAIPILKKNGQLRLVIDYRGINKVTESDV